MLKDWIGVLPSYSSHRDGMIERVIERILSTRFDPS